jgi:hypothetical protein
MTRLALLHNSGRTYLAGILSSNGIDFQQQAYRGSFFTNKFFGSIINVESWLVSPHASPPASSALNAVPSLHIFDFLSCITSISHGQNLLPAVGLTPLQAGHAGNLIYYCFAALDIKENYKTCPFESSLLRLFTWLCLLADALAVLFLWEQCPRHASYQRMLSCWSLLHIFQRWLAAIKWQQTRGFATVQDSSTLQYRVIADGRTSSNISHHQSTILTALAAYNNSTFTQLLADRVLSTMISSEPARLLPIYSIRPPSQFVLTPLAICQCHLLLSHPLTAIHVVPLTSASVQISHALILPRLPASLI